MKIYGLEDFDLREEDLIGCCAEKQLEVSIHLEYYKDVDNLRELTPKERRLIICKDLRQKLKELVKILPHNSFKLTGTRINPRAISILLTGAELLKLRDLTAEAIFIRSIEGHVKKEQLPVESYYCVKALFACVVEGFDYTNSIQVVEERILLLKAFNFEDAGQRAMVEFNEYASKSHLNTDYRFVKWEFVKVIDIYDVGETEIENTGTEVFSVWKRRKIKK